ncbi:MAG: hypothetical protein AAF690_23445, partial [Acidobacteriota bacterium]
MSEAIPQESEEARGPLRALHQAENLFVALLLGAMAVLPLFEILGRTGLGRGIPGGLPVVQHLTLWVGFLGAALAAREGRLLQLATGNFIPEGRWRTVSGVLTGAVGAAV